MDLSDKEIETLLKIVHDYTSFFLILDVVFFATLLCVVILLIRFLKAKKKLRSTNEYMLYIIRGQEAERARLSRELHDSLAQDLRWCKSLAEKLPQSKEQQELVEMLLKSIQNIRSLSYNLAPPDVTKNDLVTNVMNLCKNFQEHSKAAIRFTVPENIKTDFLTEQDTLNLYRIVQESLTNIQKHAAAHEVTVLMRNHTESETPGLYIFITDDGRGFNTQNTQPLRTQDAHLGLTGMQQRAELIHANLSVNSTPGEGTQVSIVKHFQIQ